MSKGRGEIIEPMEFEELCVNLIKPINLGISAKEAYTKFSQKKEAGLGGRENYINDLEWAVIDDYAELQEIKQKYPKSVMTGSGSTYYSTENIFEQQKEYWVKNGLKTILSGVQETE